MGEKTVAEQFKLMSSVKAATLADQGEDDGVKGSDADANKEGKESDQALQDGQHEQAAGDKAGSSSAGEGDGDSSSEGADEKDAKGNKSSSDGAGKAGEGDELQQLRAELNAANARIEAILKMQEGGAEYVPEEKEEPIKAAPISLTDFTITEEEYEKAMEDKDSFDSILKKAVTMAYNKGTEETLRVVPDLIKREVTSAIAVKTAVDEFWGQNADLKPYRKVFATIIDATQKKEPGLTLPALLQKAEVETRMQMHLPKRALTEAEKGNKEDPDKKPAFIKGSSNRANPSKPSKIQEDFLLLKNRGKL